LKGRGFYPRRRVPQKSPAAFSSRGLALLAENEFHFQDADAILTLHAAEAH
jgi:hypothetical protein